MPWKEVHPLDQRKELIDRFREEYNQERPHEALGMQTPGSFWRPSSRSVPAELPEPEYPGHLVVKRVDKNGVVNFRGRHYHLSNVLTNERVALEEVEDGVWSVIFYNTPLARLDERTLRLVHAPPAAQVGGQ